MLNAKWHLPIVDNLKQFISSLMTISERHFNKNIQIYYFHSFRLFISLIIWLIRDDSYNFYFLNFKLQISLFQNDLYFLICMTVYSSIDTTSRDDPQRYILRFFLKLRLIVPMKSVRQHVVLRDVPISTIGCRTLRNGYRSPSFAIWFMTAGDRLPSYPRAKEEQFLSALDLMGFDTTILDVPWCSYNVHCCKFRHNLKAYVKELLLKILKTNFLQKNILLYILIIEDRIYYRKNK